MSTGMINLFRILVCSLSTRSVHLLDAREKAIQLIKEEKVDKILVLVGAGISTPSGIPDFRSPKSGLYKSMNQIVKKFNLSDPESVFDMHLFSLDPQPFLSVAKKIYPGKHKPNIAHYFIRLLEKKGRLQRLYTQNIDGLERIAGISGDLLVEAHGSFATASCIKCHKPAPPERVKREIFNGTVPLCDDCQGFVKPDIVFFGESLPERFYDLHNEDSRNSNLLVVMGTSLEVFPFASIVVSYDKKKFRILINRNSLINFGGRPNDVFLRGDIIEEVEHLAKGIGWWEELREMAGLPTEAA